MRPAPLRRHDGRQPSSTTRRWKITLLGLALLAVLASHFRLEARDDRWLLLADGRPVDVLGRLSDATLRLTRRCSATAVPPTGTPAEQTLHRQVTAVLRSYSPPDSASADVDLLLRQGGWLIAQARFERLEPAAVVLRLGADGEAAVQPGAIWSGPTEPWHPGPLMRRYLQARAPAAPAALLDCYDPDPARFARR